MVVDPIMNENASSAEAVLSCKGVSKTFHTRGRSVHVLENVEISVLKGSAVAIVGRSGAGKTTLLNILGGLDTPDSGEVVFINQLLEKLRPRDLTRLRRDMVGFVFQDFNLIESWTALENVEVALALKGLSKSARLDEAEKLLSGLGLGDRLENFPRELSMGEAQRVAVARTMVKNPVLVLADEPTGSVDPETGDEIARSLIAHAKKHEACLVVATHGNFPLESMDVVLRLENGRLCPL